jgi:ElaB/YqjD/DUF883 family membrane-anchored ribosome-binding protein
MTTIHTDSPSFPSTAGSSATLDRAAEKISQVSERAAERASEVARQSARKLTDGSQQVKMKFNEVSDSAIAYVKDEPVRAMLIAAGVGAALMALAGLLGRTRHH